MKYNTKINILSQLNVSSMFSTTWYYSFSHIVLKFKTSMKYFISKRFKALKKQSTWKNAINSKEKENPQKTIISINIQVNQTTDICKEVKRSTVICYLCRYLGRKHTFHVAYYMPLASKDSLKPLLNAKLAKYIFLQKQNKTHVEKDMVLPPTYTFICF